MRRLIILLLFIFPFNAFANVKEESCDDIILELRDKLKIDKKLSLESLYEIYNYGFYLSETFDFKEKKKVIKRKNGYPIVSTFLDLELYNGKKIKSGDLILSINNKDARKIENKELYNFFLTTNDKKEKVTLEFLNLDKNKKTKLTLVKKKYEYYYTEPKFQISSINEINTVKGNFEIYYNFSYNLFFPYIGEILSKYKLFNLSNCNLKEKDIEIIKKGDNLFKYLNISKFSEDELKKSYTIGLEEIKKNDQNNKPAAILNFDFEGIAKFKNNFDFKKFPFDEQQLRISIMEMYGLYPHSFLELGLGEVMFESLNNYKNNNTLKEWEIKNFNIGLKTANLVDYDLPSNQLDITINIQRNYLYYIIKIILPIFLILSLAWYVFWINPKELESRITTSIVCFLALVAYNFVIDNEIPKLGYLTYMDWIIMISYIFCALPTAISISLYRYIKSKRYNVIEVNSYIRLVGPILYFALLISVGLVILF